MSGEVVVELNVGGVATATLLSTLRTHPASRLGKLFAVDDVALPKDSGGRLFLDRDQPTFAVVLNFLRLQKAAQMWETCLPKDPDRLALLTQEAEYWGLPQLRDAALRLLHSATDNADLLYYHQTMVESKSFPSGLSNEEGEEEGDVTRKPIYIPTESSRHKV